MEWNTQNQNPRGLIDKRETNTIDHNVKLLLAQQHTVRD
jgi:hypothetical protein